MGKWNRRYMSRPRRRNYQDYQWSPPREEPLPDPETEVWQDNVPMWEKKFCYLVGRIPWRKVLSTKNFMHCHSNVLSWDDSAGHEAFNNAKKRFWEDMSGLPCETQLPNPDMYISEIDWNPHIDPELVKELDQMYFNPDDKYYLASASSLKENNGFPDDSDNPWEHGYVQTTTVKDKATGWNQWDNSVNDTSKATRDYNPWESRHTQDKEVVKDNKWGNGWHKSWDSKLQNPSDLSKSWRAEGNSWRNEGNGWTNRGGSSRRWNQMTSDSRKPNYWNNNGKPWECGSHLGNRVPGVRDNSWGQKQKQWDNHNREVEFSGNISRGTGDFNASCRKRVSPDYYVTNHKGPRLNGGDSQPSRYWNRDDNKRVSFKGRWS